MGLLDSELAVLEPAAQHRSAVDLPLWRLEVACTQVACRQDCTLVVAQDTLAYHNSHLMVLGQAADCSSLHCSVGTAWERATAIIDQHMSEQGMEKGIRTR